MINVPSSQRNVTTAETQNKSSATGGGRAYGKPNHQPRRMFESPHATGHDAALLERRDAVEGGETRGSHVHVHTNRRSGEMSQGNCDETREPFFIPLFHEALRLSNIFDFDCVQTESFSTARRFGRLYPSRRKFLHTSA